MHLSKRARLLALVGGVVLAGALYGGISLLGESDAGFSDELGGGQAAVRVAVDREWAKHVPDGARVLARVADDVAPRLDGRVYEISSERAPRRAGTLVCKQVHASVAGPGLCLALSKDGVDYEGIVFDDEYAIRARFPVEGVPDRARVSPDGRYGAFTTFDRGSSGGYFANSSDFSTDTRIVDMDSGRSVLRLTDELRVTRRGRRFASEDVQYWGVTFASGDRFYATMAVDFDHYLIAGDVQSGRARVVARHIECPALSPDGRRVAYKRRIPYTDTWRLHVRDLRSGRDVALAEPRSVDDQPEWLGNDRIVYSDDRALFTVPADGSGRAERLARHASSPSMVNEPRG